MNEIRSHPDLMLTEHLAEIRAAAKGILSRHGMSLFLNCPEIAIWFDDAVALHDTGKASPQFQAYIPAPEKYLGRPKEKAHTPLSTLFTIHHGTAEGWDWRRTLAVAQVAAGHHSEFRDLSRELMSSTKRPRKSGSLLEEYLVNSCEILEIQMPDIDHDALQRAVGLALPRFEDLKTEDAVDEASDLLKFDFRDKLDLLSVSEAVRYRLLVQLVFSVLLEADKAFLAVPEADRIRYLAPRAAELPHGRVTEYLADKPASAMDGLRADARSAMLAGMGSANGRVCTMTLPTGTGKTLLAATWALETRERLLIENSVAPVVLIVLPFLTVIEQTAKEYDGLFPEASGTGVITNYHSLSDRTFAPNLEGQSQDFFLDTWLSDVVVTTFDQFLYALFSPKAKHQMRFHNLADAIVVLDEVQALPCVLWEPLGHAIAGLTQLGSTHLLAMSATQPGFLPEARELIDKPAEFFGRLNRYRIVLRHRKPIGISTFIEECLGRLAGEWQGKRVMLTLNTRRSARRVRDALADAAEKEGFSVEFLTADVTPADRLAAVERIKVSGRSGMSCLVISTQCVEAGVDIDLDFVIRDFGPLDSIFQIAGRCNRNGRIERGIVEIVRLVDDESNQKPEFAKQVYDKVLLEATHIALGPNEFIEERDVYSRTMAYYDLLKERKDTGAKALNDWAYWREMEESVRVMLRGPDRQQVTFVVIERDPALSFELESLSSIKDKWEKRRAFRSLAGRIARISVSVYERGHLDPRDYAEPFPTKAEGDAVWFWLLLPGHYTPERGLAIGDSAGEATWGTII